MKFSVVIPLYNKKESVLRAVHSVLNQTYKNFELIIVDDGSTDGSYNQLSNVHDSRVKVIKQSNSGVSVARNKGVQNSTSDYVCFLDADDEWDESFLYEIMSLILDSPESVIFCTRYEMINEKGKPFIGKLFTKDNYFGVLNDFYSAYSKSRSLICSSNVCVNKNMLLKVGGFPVGVKTGEDIYVWLLLSLKGAVSFSSKILSKIYANAENRTDTRVDVEIIYHLKYFLVDYNKGLKVRFKEKTLKIFLCRNAVVHASNACILNRRDIARTYAKMLLPLSPLYSSYVLLITFIPNFVINIIKKIRDTILN